MTYANDDFWKKYAEYVEESFPRHKDAINKLMGRTIYHDRDWRGGLGSLGSILDLGCGQVMKGTRFAREKTKYIGVDEHPREVTYGYQVLPLNYRTQLNVVADMCREQEFYPSTILSLFSIELTGSPWANESLYLQLFNQIASAWCIITAGFFYEDKDMLPTVIEAGGLESWQSIGPLSKEMKETRLFVRAPSTLFGPNVIEVWRLLERK